MVEPHISIVSTGWRWPVLTDDSFTVYETEVTEKIKGLQLWELPDINIAEPVLHLEEIPGLNTADNVKIWTSPWHAGAVAILSQVTAGSLQDEILRYDAKGALTNHAKMDSRPSSGRLGNGNPFGAIVSPVIYSLAPYGSFGMTFWTGHHRPELKLSTWLLAVAFNILSILLMMGLMFRTKPDKQVRIAWIVCAVILSLPALLIFLAWMPWRESKERKRIEQKQGMAESPELT